MHEESGECCERIDSASSSASCNTLTDRTTKATTMTSREGNAAPASLQTGRRRQLPIPRAPSGAGATGGTPIRRPIQPSSLRSTAFVPNSSNLAPRDLPVFLKLGGAQSRMDAAHSVVQKNSNGRATMGKNLKAADKAVTTSEFENVMRVESSELIGDASGDMGDCAVTTGVDGVVESEPLGVQESLPSIDDVRVVNQRQPREEKRYNDDVSKTIGQGSETEIMDASKAQTIIVLDLIHPTLLVTSKATDSNHHAVDANQSNEKAAALSHSVDRLTCVSESSESLLTGTDTPPNSDSLKAQETTVVVSTVDRSKLSRIVPPVGDTRTKSLLKKPPEVAAVKQRTGRQLPNPAGLSGKQGIKLNAALIGGKDEPKSSLTELTKSVETTESQLPGLVRKTPAKKASQEGASESSVGSIVTSVAKSETILVPNVTSQSSPRALNNQLAKKSLTVPTSRLTMSASFSLKGTSMAKGSNGAVLRSGLGKNPTPVARSLTLPGVAGLTKNSSKLEHVNPLVETVESSDGKCGNEIPTDAVITDDLLADNLPNSSKLTENLAAGALSKRFRPNNILSANVTLGTAPIDNSSAGVQAFPDNEPLRSEPTNTVLPVLCERRTIETSNDEAHTIPIVHENISNPLLDESVVEGDDLIHGCSSTVKETGAILHSSRSTSQESFAGNAISLPTSANLTKEGDEIQTLNEKKMQSDCTTSVDQVNSSNVETKNTSDAIRSIPIQRKLSDKSIVSKEGRSSTANQTGSLIPAKTTSSVRSEPNTSKLVPSQLKQRKNKNSETLAAVKQEKEQHESREVDLPIDSAKQGVLQHRKLENGAEINKLRFNNLHFSAESKPVPQGKKQHVAEDNTAAKPAAAASVPLRLTQSLRIPVKQIGVGLHTGVSGAGGATCIAVTQKTLVTKRSSDVAALSKSTLKAKSPDLDSKTSPVSESKLSRGSIISAKGVLAAQTMRAKWASKRTEQQPRDGVANDHTPPATRRSAMPSQQNANQPNASSSETLSSKASTAGSRRVSTTSVEASSTKRSDSSLRRLSQASNPLTDVKTCLSQFSRHSSDVIIGQSASSDIMASQSASSDTNTQKIVRSGQRFSDVTRPEKFHHRKSDVTPPTRLGASESSWIGKFNHRLSDVSKPEKLSRSVFNVSRFRQLGHRFSDILPSGQSGLSDATRPEQLGHRKSTAATRSLIQLPAHRVADDVTRGLAVALVPPCDDIIDNVGNFHDEKNFHDSLNSHDVRNSRDVKNSHDVIAPGLAYSRQPDVVSDSMHPPVSAEVELQDLTERLGRARGALARAGAELGLQGRTVEALAVVAAHFHQQLTELKTADRRARDSASQLKLVQRQLTTAVSKQEVLLQQRDALIAEIQSMQESSEVQLNGMLLKHHAELEGQACRLSAALATAEETHEQKIASLTQKMTELTEGRQESEWTFAAEMSEQKGRLLKQLADSETAHKTAVCELKTQQDTRVKELSTQFERFKISLLEKSKQQQKAAECSHCSGGRSPTLQATPTESGDSQSSASKVELLEQEVSSLKTVEELRNKEICKLKTQNVELEKQLEELVEARAAVSRLQHKLENAEAMVDMKSGFDRELSEKHNALLRVLDKESRSNRLLSQQNEQLEWKLTHAGVPPSPDIMRRSLDLPPPSPSPGGAHRPPGSTPDLMRRSLQFPPGSSGFESRPVGSDVQLRSRTGIRAGSAKTRSKCRSEAGASEAELEDGTQGETQLVGSSAKAGFKSGSSAMDAMRLSLGGFVLPTRSAPGTPRVEKRHNSVGGADRERTRVGRGAARPTSLLLDDLDLDLNDEDSLEFLNLQDEEDN